MGCHCHAAVCGWRRDRKDALMTRLLPSRLANRLISLTTGVLIMRLLQGVAVRVSRGPLESWLGEAGATGPHALSWRVFAGTRGAYGG